MKTKGNYRLMIILGLLYGCAVLGFTTTGLIISSITISGTLKYGDIFFGASPDSRINIFFNKDVSQNTLQNNILLIGIKDNLNKKKYEIVKTTISYNISNGSFVVTVTPLSLLEYGWCYQIKVTTNVKALDGTNIDKEFVQKFLVILSTITSYIVAHYEETQKKVELNIPPNSLPKAGYIITKEPSEENKTKTIIAANRLDNKFIVEMIEISIYDNQHRLMKEKLNNYAMLTFRYLDKDDDGYVDNTIPRIKVNTLSIYYLDKTDNLLKLPSKINTVNKTVEAIIDRTSVFTLIGVTGAGVEDVICYPVPWIPEDDKDYTGTLEEGIQFRNLSPPCKIFIYTITGELVREIEVAGNEIIKSWDGKNFSGEDVASGVYLWKVVSNVGEKNGKLIIIR